MPLPKFFKYCCFVVLPTILIALLVGSIFGVILSPILSSDYQNTIITTLDVQAMKAFTTTNQLCEINDFQVVNFEYTEYCGSGLVNFYLEAFSNRTGSKIHPPIQNILFEQCYNNTPFSNFTHRNKRSDFSNCRKNKYVLEFIYVLLILSVIVVIFSVIWSLFHTIYYKPCPEPCYKSCYCGKRNKESILNMEKGHDGNYQMVDK